MLDYLGSYLGAYLGDAVESEALPPAPVWTFVNKTEITFTQNAGWIDQDLTGIVPAGTKTVVLEIVNTSPDTRFGCNVRPNDSGMTRAPYLQNGKNIYFMVGLDGNLIFERLWANTALKVFLVAYSPLVRTATSPYADVNVPGSTYADIDCSALPAAATFAFFEKYSGASSIYQYAVRPKNAAWDSYYNSQYYANSGIIFSGLDANRFAEGRISNAAMDFFLLGWGESEIVPISVATKTPSTTGWQTIGVATECPNGVAALVELVNTHASVGKSIAVRGAGDTWDQTAYCGMGASSHNYAIVPLNASGQFEAYVGTDTSAEIKILGYIEQPQELTLSPANGTMTKVGDADDWPLLNKAAIYSGGSPLTTYDVSGGTPRTFVSLTNVSYSPVTGKLYMEDIDFGYCPAGVAAQIVFDDGKLYWDITTPPDISNTNVRFDWPSAGVQLEEPTTTYTLTAAGGNFALAGVDSDLLYHRYLALGGESVSITGVDAVLLRQAIIAAATGPYLLSGSSAGLRYSGALATKRKINMEMET